MTYKQMKNISLQLINRYSSAGNLIPGTYNDQQDYLNRIPALANDAVMYIASVALPITATAALSQMEKTERDGIGTYTLPSDCMKVKNLSLTYTENGLVKTFTDVYAADERHILAPVKLEASTIEYFRFPVLLPEEPRDDDELDNTPATHGAVPFYVAAHLLLDDNEFGYAALYSEFEDRIKKLTPGVYASGSLVCDEYGIMDGGY